MADRPTVFISYSWDSEEHKAWVLKLAKDLSNGYGAIVLLDQVELSVGKDLTYFMENSIEKATKVLMIMTPNYKKKAEGRSGGIGFEYSMISQELYEVQLGNIKFIPILRSGTSEISCPKYVKSKIYHPMTEDSNYHSDLHKLAMIIYDKQTVEKLEPGPIPNFDDPDFDPFISKANEIAKKEELNREYDRILDSPEGISLANEEVQRLYNSIKDKAERYSSKTAFTFQIKEERDSLIVSSSGYSVLLSWHPRYSNSLTDAKLGLSTWNGYLHFNNPGYVPGEEPKRVSSTSYEFDFDKEGNYVWRESDKFRSNQEIETLVFTYIMDNIQKKKEKGFREK